MARRTAGRRPKVAEKIWFTIVAPEIFGGVEVGETPADDPAKLIGRVVETTLRDITGDFTKSHVKLKFKIYDVRGRIAYTKFHEHELTRDYVRSLVRRRTTKVEGIIDVVTKDGYKVRVKALAFTTKRIKTSQERAIRAVMFETIREFAQKLTFNEFILYVVTGKLNTEIFQRAHKIYPLRAVEIRKTELLAEPVPGAAR